MKILLDTKILLRCKFKKLYSTKVQLCDEPKVIEEPPVRSKKIVDYYESNNHLKKVIEEVPSKYCTVKRRSRLNSLYLTDKTIAKSVVKHVLPDLLQNTNQAVCETNAGLGLITRELLKKGVKVVRVYESCSEFRNILSSFSNADPNRVQLFGKNIFNLDYISKMDAKFSSNVVKKLLEDVPVKKWSDDPIMTIIGPMPNLSFIDYLIRMLTTQQEIVQYGRPQIFAIMKPMEFIKCTATPGMSLHAYQKTSVLFQMFFDYEFLEKYPRTSFLPWETKLKIHSRSQYHSKHDLDYMYLVKMNLKRELPVQTEYLLHLHYFVKQCMFKRKSRVIPVLENWLPGIGLNLIVPKVADNDIYFQNMSVYTEFGELSSVQMLHVFLEMIQHPDYHISAFVDLLTMKKKESINGDLMEYNDQ